MNDGYPEEQELKTIKNWEYYTDFSGLMEYIKNLWKYPQYWKETQTDNQIKYKISTGGWSGNEDLIAAMISNRIFWAVCWLSSHRGGHYEFQVKQHKEKDNG